MKRLAILVLAAACGSSNPAPAAPPAAPPATTAPASTGLLGIGEIAIKDNGKDVLVVHANGDIQFADEGGWKSIGKIDASGKMVATDNEAGQLQADGSFTTPEGPAPFKLDGAALVAGGKRVTIENGKLVGLGD